MYLKFILSRVNSLEHRVGGSPVYCMYICMCIYVYMCVCMCMCLCVCMCVYIYICICMCICNYISYLTLWKISLFFKLTLGPPITQLSYGWPSVWYTFVLLYLILWCVTVCLVSCMSYWNKSIVLLYCLIFIQDMDNYFWIWINDLPWLWVSWLASGWSWSQDEDSLGSYDESVGSTCCSPVGIPVSQLQPNPMLSFGKT